MLRQHLPNMLGRFDMLFFIHRQHQARSGKIALASGNCSRNFTYASDGVRPPQLQLSHYQGGITHISSFPMSSVTFYANFVAHPAHT